MTGVELVCSPGVRAGVRAGVLRGVWGVVPVALRGVSSGGPIVAILRGKRSRVERISARVY